MGNAAFLLLMVALLLCLSPLASCTSTASIPPYPRTKPQRKDTDHQFAFEALLNLFGTPEQVASVKPQVADQFRSCFKYLVPPSPNSTLLDSSNPIKMVTSSTSVGDADQDNEKVWFPPDAVMELVRGVLDSGGDPQTIRNALDPVLITISDIEGAQEAGCTLTKPFGQRFMSDELNNYQEFLFKLIVERCPNIGLNVALNRFDLFRGHLFVTEDSRLGMLEYPPYDKSTYPYDLSPCQTGSPVNFTDSIDMRNILWLAPYVSGDAWLPGVLVVLDTRPDGIIYQDLIYDSIKNLRIIYEGDFGEIAVVINYLNVALQGPPAYRLYVT